MNDALSGLSEPQRAELRRIAACWNDDIATHVDQVLRIYAPLAHAADKAGVTRTLNLPYGEDPRQVLDIFQPAEPRPGAPVVIFVHGGAFTRGAKSIDGDIHDNVLYWFAAQGCVGINIEYRLAPQAPYPEGARDVGAAVAWAQTNIARFGGDPRRIFLIGHSAGGTHVATYLLDPVMASPPSPSVRGAALISARLRADVLPDNPNAKPVETYFATTNPNLLEARSPTTHVARCNLPILVAIAGAENRHLDVYGAEFFTGLLRNARHPARLLQLPHHTHISMVAHFNTGEEILGRAIMAFMSEAGH